MLRFISTILRVLAGFVLACLAAGYVQVFFAVTPVELIEAPDERLNYVFRWGLLAATQIAVFSAPFVLISALLSEWIGLRSFAYHAMIGMAIAVAGFGLIHANESPTEASIVNSYAMAAYLTSGFVGGFVYWLFSGRFAKRKSDEIVHMESDRPLAAPPAPKPPQKPVDAKPPTENARIAAAKRRAAAEDDARLKEKTPRSSEPENERS